MTNTRENQLLDIVAEEQKNPLPSKCHRVATEKPNKCAKSKGAAGNIALGLNIDGFLPGSAT